MHQSKIKQADVYKNSLIYSETPFLSILEKQVFRIRLRAVQCTMIGLILLKFRYPEKATKFCKISTVDLFYLVAVKSTVEISQNFVAFSEYMNFTLELIIALGQKRIKITVVLQGNGKNQKKKK